MRAEQPDATVLQGGTDVMVEINFGRLDPVAPEPEPDPATGNRLDLAGPWRRVSPKYVAVEVVSAVVSSVVLLAVPVGMLLIGVDWAWILVLAAAILAVTLLIVAPRRARAYGYRLRQDDLLFRRGIMFQRFVSVPYGRMGTAEDLTGMAVFLASDEADYIVAQTYNVDGGNWMS